MRNLRNLRFDNWKLRDISNGDWDTKSDGLTAICWDAASDNLLGVIGPSSTGAIELVRTSDDGQTYVILH